MSAREYVRFACDSGQILSVAYAACFFSLINCEQTCRRWSLGRPAALLADRDMHPRDRVQFAGRDL